MRLPNTILYFHLRLKVNLLSSTTTTLYLDIIKTSKHFIKVDMKKTILKNYAFVIFAYRLHSILISIGLSKKKKKKKKKNTHGVPPLHFFFFFSHFILKRRGQTTDIRDYGEGKWWADFEEGK